MLVKKENGDYELMWAGGLAYMRLDLDKYGSSRDKLNSGLGFQKEYNFSQVVVRVITVNIQTYVTIVII